jgi:hypothetical protein
MFWGDSGNNSGKAAKQGKLSFDGHDVTWEDPSGSKVSWSREAFEEVYGGQLKEPRHTFTNGDQEKSRAEGRSKEAQDMAEETRRLIQVRSQMLNSGN